MPVANALDGTPPTIAYNAEATATTGLSTPRTNASTVSAPRRVDYQQRRPAVICVYNDETARVASVRGSVMRPYLASPCMSDCRERGQNPIDRCRKVLSSNREGAMSLMRARSIRLGSRQRGTSWARCGPTTRSPTNRLYDRPASSRADETPRSSVFPIPVAFRPRACRTRPTSTRAIDLAARHDDLAEERLRGNPHAPVGRVSRRSRRITPPPSTACRGRGIWSARLPCCPFGALINGHLRALFDDRGV